MVLSAYALAVIFFWRGIAAKLVVPPCDQHMFDSGVDNCLSDFNKSMETSGYQDSCPWPTEIRIYNKLKRCVDDWAKESWCKGHGFLRDTVFLEVHKMYFRLCGQVQDPPSTTLIVLIAPVIIITLFLPILCVKLTTWNTNYVSTFKL
ncbi:receptor activity-modifying protein 1-like [Anoplopoma fimbria]|uniref:receptor activity-modifying protein 1-like n=1 Tax=Anoplopoma fimbria TaxID=229290 RepID=UPI0023EC77CE|nr:receptor activity-modifying protein 1-like [Anoplopoma fimbria]XP_054471887.1 receptor activity-modifying protein 1-like [Anoplopoma fimbria]